MEQIRPQIAARTTSSLQRPATLGLPNAASSGNLFVFGTSQHAAAPAFMGSFISEPFKYSQICSASDLIRSRDLRRKFNILKLTEALL